MYIPSCLLYSVKATVCGAADVPAELKIINAFALQLVLYVVSFLYVSFARSVFFYLSKNV